jgi:hypothetical protein
LGGGNNVTATLGGYNGNKASISVRPPPAFQPYCSPHNWSCRIVSGGQRIPQGTRRPTRGPRDDTSAQDVIVTLGLQDAMVAEATPQQDCRLGRRLTTTTNITTRYNHLDDCTRLFPCWHPAVLIFPTQLHMGRNAEDGYFIETVSFFRCASISSTQVCQSVGWWQKIQTQQFYILQATQM